MKTSIQASDRSALSRAIDLMRQFGLGSEQVRIGGLRVTPRRLADLGIEEMADDPGVTAAQLCTEAVERHGKGAAQ